MGILDHDVLVNARRVYNKFVELIDEYGECTEFGKVNMKSYYAQVVKKMKETQFWNLYYLSDKICMHVYKNGKNAGEICGNKVFITTEDKLQKILCSRHCRNYKPKGRTYDSEHIRCNYIKKNEAKCKHKCGNGDNYCYIHKKLFKEEPINKFVENNKEIFIKKLETKKLIYFKLKNKKRILYTQNSEKKGQRILKANRSRHKNDKYNINFYEQNMCPKCRNNYKSTGIT